MKYKGSSWTESGGRVGRFRWFGSPSLLAALATARAAVEDGIHEVEVEHQATTIIFRCGNRVAAVNRYPQQNEAPVR